MHTEELISNRRGFAFNFRSGSRTGAWRTRGSGWRWLGLTQPTPPFTAIWWATRETCRIRFRPISPWPTTHLWAAWPGVRPPQLEHLRLLTLCAHWTLSGFFLIHIRVPSCSARSDTRRCTQVQVMPSVPAGALARASLVNQTGLRRGRRQTQTSHARPLAEMTLSLCSRRLFSANRSPFLLIRGSKYRWPDKTQTVTDLSSFIFVRLPQMNYNAWTTRTLQPPTACYAKLCKQLHFPVMKPAFAECRTRFIQYDIFRASIMQLHLFKLN